VDIRISANSVERKENILFLCSHMNWWHVVIWCFSSIYYLF